MKARYSLHKKRKALVKIAIIVSLLPLFIIFFKNFYLQSSRGLDFSDESFHLLDASDSKNEFYFHSLYGYYTSILYEISRSNIFLFRAMGIALLFSSSIYFVSAAIKVIWQRPRCFLMHSKMLMLSLSLVITTSYYGIGLISPSYNWGNFLSMNLGVASIFHLINSSRIWTIGLHISMYILAINLSLLTKPTTSVFLAVLLFFAAFLRFSSHKKKILFASSGIVFLIVSLWIWDFLINYYEISNEGLNRLKLFDVNYGFTSALKLMIIGFRDFFFTLPGMAYVFIIPTLSFISFLFVRLDKQVKYQNCNSVLFFALLGLPLIMGKWNGDYQANSELGALSVLTILLSSICSIAGLKRSNEGEQYDATIFIFAIFCMLVVYPFGSNNGYLPLLAATAGWSLTALVVANWRFLSDRTSKYLAYFLLLAVALQIQTFAIKKPYEGIDLSANNFNINTAGTSGGRLLLDEEKYQYVVEIGKILRSSGWKRGDQMLDFSDYNSAIPYLFGASPLPTVILTVPGYPGVNHLLRENLTNYLELDSFRKGNYIWIIRGTGPQLKYREKLFAPSIEILEKKTKMKFKLDFTLVGSYKNLYIYKSQRKFKST